MSTTPSGHKFNDDLLANSGDLAFAQKHYEGVWPALDHPALRELFKSYDEPANALKRASRTWGRRAIGFGFFALVMAAAEPLLHGLPKHVHLTLLAIAGLAGVASVGIGAWGLMNTAALNRWLRNRFMTERLRQLHFQTIVRHFAAIAAEPTTAPATTSVKDGPGSTFEAQRARALSLFRNMHEQQTDAQMHSAIEDDDAHHLWLLDPPTSQGPIADTPAARKLVEAYRDLRIKHQLGYAVYQLRDADRISTGAIRWQAKLLWSIGVACIAGLLTIHVIIVVAILLGALAGNDGATKLASNPLLHVVALWIVALAMAARALEEGLKPEREIERYQQYRSAVQAILQRYEAAPTIEAKLAVMEQMERCAYDEMRAFLHTHRQAKFLM